MTEDHVLRNRAMWNEFATEFVEPGHEAWASPSPPGHWGVPRPSRHARGVDGSTRSSSVRDRYVSAWLARRGARPIGLDNSPVQLATRDASRTSSACAPARARDAERTPFPDASFDLAISEYGAAIWCDPYRGSRGGTDPATRRPARLPRQLLPLDDLHAARRGPPHRRATCTATLRDAPVRLVRRRLDRVPHPARRVDRPAAANGFDVEELLELEPPEDGRQGLQVVPIELGSPLAEREGSGSGPASRGADGYGKPGRKTGF